MGTRDGDFVKAPRLQRSTTAVGAEASRVSEASTFNATVNGRLSEALKACNGRDVAAVSKHIETLEGAIGKDVEAGRVGLSFGGSVRKHTFVDGLSDVDLLAIVSDSSLADASPKDLLEGFAARIRARLPFTEVKVGALAITVKFADGVEIQLLPAQRTATGIRIKVPFEDEWSNVVRPDRFARKLTEVNQACSRNVVPVIKLYKALQSQFPKPNQLSGYHVESLAIEAFRDYSGGRNLKDMFLHFCEQVSERVLAPIRETTGQSLHVDDKLGAEGSDDRVRISAAVERLVGRLRAAEDRGDAEAWRREFDGE